MYGDMHEEDAIYIIVQVDVPGFQARFHHSTTAFNLCPGLTEVTLFGGGRKPFRRDILAKTTVLRFGESSSAL